MTQEQIIEAWKMRSRNISFDRVGKVFGIGAKTVRNALYPDLAKKDNSRRRLRRAQFQNSKTAHSVGGHPVHIPAEVLADRDIRRLSESRSLTAVLMGDPMPGRSALDKKMVKRADHGAN